MKVVIVLLIFLLSPYESFALNPSAKFLPPDGNILLFVGQDRESIDTYSHELNLIPAGVMVYTSLQTLGGIDSQIDYGAGFQDGGYLLREYPDSALQVGLYLVGTLKDILNGKYDANIHTLGQWLQDARRPIFLRIGYEFDMPQNDYNPQLYKKTFQYLVRHWREQGVNNVAYVWHSYGVQNPLRHYLDWYPGDDYVDWFGVSFFNLYHQPDTANFAKLAKEHHKPLMIAEASPNSTIPVNGKIRWERWYKSLFSFVQEYDVRAVSYINCEWDKFPMWKGQGWGDSRVEKDFYIKDKWLKEIGNPQYLKSSTRLFKQLGFH